MTGRAGEFARELQPREGKALVRWLDGAPAATEIGLGRGCIREVAIPVDPVGDVALRESFGGVVQLLVEPCGGARDFVSAIPSPSAVIPSPSAVIPSPSAVIPSPSAVIPSPPVIPSEARDLQLANMQIPRRSAPRDDALPLWLAVAALVALIGEQWLRTRRRAVA